MKMVKSNKASASISYGEHFSINLQVCLIDKASKLDMGECISILNGGKGKEDFLRCQKYMIKAMEGVVWPGESRARYEVRKLTRGGSGGALNTMPSGLEIFKADK